MADLDRSGVYCITHLESGKRYVGSAAKTIRGRWRNHLSLLNRQKHHSIHLQRAWDKFGADAFEWLILENCEPEQCLIREQFYIESFLSADPDHGYNILPRAGSRLGSRTTDEAKAKQRAAKLGKKTGPQPAEMVEKRRQAIIGRKRGPLTEAHREKLRIAMTGKIRGPEHAEATRQGMLGKKHTPERRENQRKARMAYLARTQT